MIFRQQRFGWKALAAIAVIISLALLLLPHASDLHVSALACFVLLPVLLFGVVEVPRSLWPASHTKFTLPPLAPVLSALFQRPPPVTA